MTPHPAVLLLIVMAKTYKNLFSQITNFKSLYEAYLKARKGRRYRPEILQFSQKLEENLLQLQNELTTKTYKTGTYKTFYVYEPKPRFIAALPFRDRVVHHAIVAAIEPIWEKRFIYDSYACRINKGTHACVDRAQYFLRRAKRRWGDIYCLKADIAKYFQNIDHATLKGLIRKRIACKDTVWLIEEIIDSAKILDIYKDKGMPIGNLTSQLFANMYLHELDKHIKHTLREPFYVRYMDDFIILGTDKSTLHKTRRKVAQYLKSNLHLTMNGKTQVIKIKSTGVTFLGYRIWPTHRLLSNNTKRRITKKINKYKKLYQKERISWCQINTSLQSYLAHIKHCNSHRLTTKIIASIASITPQNQ